MIKMSTNKSEENCQILINHDKLPYQINKENEKEKKNINKRTCKLKKLFVNKINGGVD